MIFYKRWLNRQSRFESTPVIQTNGLIKKHETILMHNFIKLSSLYRAIGCFHVHQSYRGREIDLGLGVVDREMLKKKSTPARWHVIGSLSWQLLFKWPFLPNFIIQYFHAYIMYVVITLPFVLTQWVQLRWCTSYYGMFYYQINEIGLSLVKYMQYITSDIQYFWDP